MDSDSLGAVSPVVGVILMVAVTVILSAVIGTFVLDLGQQTADSASSTDIGTRTDYSNGTVTVTVITGTADELKLLVNGTVVSRLTTVTAGKTISEPVSPGSTVRIVSVQDGSETVVSATTIGSGQAASTGTTATVPTTGLVAYYPFDGTASDATGNGHGPKTIYGNPSYSSGKVNKSVYLDGDDGYYMGYNPSMSNRTISIWFKTSVLQNQTLIWTPDKEGQFRVENTDNLLGTVNAGGAWKTAATNSSHSVADGVWHHAVLVVNSTQHIKLYLDGNLVDTQSIASVTTGSSWNVSIGYDEYGRLNSPPAEWTNGSVDEVRIYNRTLNDSEVSELYQAEK